MRESNDNRFFCLDRKKISVKERARVRCSPDKRNNGNDESIIPVQRHPVFQAPEATFTCHQGKLFFSFVYYHNYNADTNDDDGDNSRFSLMSTCGSTSLGRRLAL